MKAETLVESEAVHDLVTGSEHLLELRGIVHASAGEVAAHNHSAVQAERQQNMHSAEKASMHSAEKASMHATETASMHAAESVIHTLG